MYMNRHEEIPGCRETSTTAACPGDKLIHYTVIYSDSSDTPFTETGRLAECLLLLCAVQSIAGDGVVPWFSAQGKELDPNNGTLTVIPAFARTIIEMVRSPGQHSGYIQLPDVVGNIYTRLVD